MNKLGHYSRNFQARSSGKGKWKSQPQKATKKTRKLEKQIRQQNARQAQNNNKKKFELRQPAELNPALAAVQLNIIALLLH